MSNISVADVLGQFDRLIKEGELFYSPAEPIKATDQGLEFELRIVPSFSAKPQVDHPEETAQSSHRPQPTDGSDIDHADPAFFVAHVGAGSASTVVDKRPDNATHKLILNKFCVFRPQYLLLTADPTQKQTSPLDLHDLAAAWTLLQELGGQQEHYVIFNCSPVGGSSRNHKHMQVFQMPPQGARSLLWPGAKAVKNQGKGPEILSVLDLPYVALFAELDDSDPNSVEQLVLHYAQHVEACRRVLKVQQGSDDDLPHNVVMTRKWLITIPRRQATVDGIKGHVVNSTGMLGLPWCNNQEQADGWKEAGLVNVLRELGVPV